MAQYTDKQTRLVFLITAHRKSGQVARLIRALQHPLVDIYLHVDKKSNLDLSLLPSGVSMIRRNVEVGWRLYSQVQAIINSLEQILEEQQEFDYLYYISGQDYPVLPVSEMIATLALTPGRQYIHHVTLDRDGWDKARVRFERFYFLSYPRWWIRMAGGVFTFVCDRIGYKRRFYLGMKPWGGSAWWTLTRPCLAYVLQYLRDHPAMVTFMKKTIHPDEMLFQTIILHSDFARQVVNDNLRFIDWVKGNPNPNILTAADAERIIAARPHFARKLDIETDVGLFDLLDDYRQRQERGISS